MINVPYVRAGVYIRNFLKENGYDISLAIEVDSTKETTIFNEDDTKGIIISQNIKKEDVPEHISLYEGGFGLRIPDLGVFSISNQLVKTNIETIDNNYFILGNARHINEYKELINEKNVLFYFYEPLKKGKSKNNNLIEKDTCIVGDKEYQEQRFDVLRYGRDTYQLILYYPTGRILTNKSGRNK